MATTISYQMLDSALKVEQAIQDLRSYSTLAVDCEGVDLGRDGRLCLVQVATPTQVYIFDIVGLGSQAFDIGLRGILEDSAVTKLFFDCREDCNAMKHQYNVNVEGIQDLQLMDVLGKKICGKRHEFVNGLRKSLSFHLPGCGFSGAEKERMHRAFDEDKSLWMRRPLKLEYLQYAATDVFYLLKLEQKLTDQVASSVSESVLREIVKYASTRYADFMRSNDKYADNQYFRNPRLPLNIVPQLAIARNRVVGYEAIADTGTQCSSCGQVVERVARLSQCSRCLEIDRVPRR